MSLIGVISLGCAKNQVDTERMLGYLAAAGHTFTNDPAEAEVLIVNTCGFIEPAKQESINTILEMAEYKKHGRCKTLVATGCLTKRYMAELKEALPEVDILLGFDRYAELPSLLAGDARPFCAPDAGRILTTPAYSAYLRVGDGCNNRCTYCAIPLIRGALRSTPMESLVDEAKSLADGGVTELTVIAQDTSGYGRDLYGKPMLLPLLDALSRIDALHWIRVLYTYPDTVTPELIDFFASNPKVVKYLDMPLQHINDDILRRMNRRGSRAHIERVLDHLKTSGADFTLRTTMMVGFPGETDFGLSPRIPLRPRGRVCLFARGGYRGRGDGRSTPRGRQGGAARCAHACAAAHFPGAQRGPRRADRGSADRGHRRRRTVRPLAGGGARC